MKDVQMETMEEMFWGESVENLLLIAALGKGAIRSGARRELERRRVVEPQFAFEDSYMTNLSVVC